MATLQLYAPLLGIVVFIFGAIRIFIRSDITDGGQGPFSANANSQVGFSMLLRALANPANRIDLAIVGIGLLVLAGFVISISIGG
jgi:hypothetical protein